MKKYLVYLITNKVNGKVYIGKTYQSLQKRWSQHLKISKNIAHYRRKGRAHYLHNALALYGADKFELSILSEYTNHEECLEGEKQWVLTYNSYIRENGYNLTMGGEGNIPSQANIEKRIKSARKRRDEGGYRVKLNKAQVLEIKNLLLIGGITQKELAKTYNVRPHTIGRIGKNEIFKDILENTPIISIDGDIIPPGYLMRGGSNNSQAKFTQEEIITIRQEYESGITITDLAKKYKCATRTMSRIVNKLSYI